MPALALWAEVVAARLREGPLQLLLRVKWGESQDMQRRIELRIQDEMRHSSIKTGQIITRLQQLIMGERDTPGQHVAAAKVLLDKMFPNLTAQDRKILSDMDEMPSMAELDVLRKQFKEMQVFQERIIDVIAEGNA